MKKAFITGITGQDGSYLAELLLEKGYEVHGLVRRLSKPNYTNIEHILEKIVIHMGDLTDSTSLITIANSINPDEVYNLGAQSFVAGSWKYPISTAEITGLGVLRMLEAFPDGKFYQASSSEMFGNCDAQIINEDTPMNPRSPYGCAKVLGHNLTKNYRESYDRFCVSGILFNHESERRGHEFVTRKISHHVAAIKLGLKDKLKLGNIDSQRDWGYAPDYVEAMWLMMQNEKPKDYVIATGKTHSVRDFCKAAFDYVDLNWEDYTEYNNEADMRPAELDWLKGDSTLAEKELGWIPQTSFNNLVERMVDNDMRLMNENNYIKSA